MAAAVADLLGRSGFAVTVAAAEQAGFTEPGPRLIGYGALAPARFAVVATQGRGGEAALPTVLASSDGYAAFVGSRRRANALRGTLFRAGIDAGRLARLHAPAGLDFGAVTPARVSTQFCNFRRLAVARWKPARRAEAPCCMMQPPLGSGRLPLQAPLRKPPG